MSTDASSEHGVAGRQGNNLKKTNTDGVYGRQKNLIGKKTEGEIKIN